MKINSEIAFNDEVDRALRYGVKTLCRLHKKYHHTNSCDDLVSLAFEIGHEFGFYSSQLSSANIRTREKFYGLYYHLRNMCERKAFKIYNQ